MRTTNIRINGRMDRWNVIDEYITDGGIHFYLMENDYFGDETDYPICVIEDNNYVEWYSTFDNIKQALYDAEFISFEEYISERG